MAGDWIIIQNVTPDKPEVFRIADSLEIDPDAVVGKLVRVWVWADQQTYDGHAVSDDMSRTQRDISVTRSLIDRVAGVTGFADAMVAAGWLEQEGDGFQFTNFDRYNGETSKQRALASKRKQRQRVKSHAATGQMSREQRDKSVTREEKRRDNERTIEATGISEFPEKVWTLDAEAGLLPILSDWFDTYGDGLPQVNGKPPTARDVLAAILATRDADAEIPQRYAAKVMTNGVHQKWVVRAQKLIDSGGKR